MILLLTACHPEPSLRYPEITHDVLARVDTDGSGYVEAEEYTRVSLPETPLDHFDTDGDGRLSPAEVEHSLIDESVSAMLEQQAHRRVALPAR